MENYNHRYEIRIGEKEKKALEKLKSEGINTSQMLRDYILKMANQDTAEQSQEEEGKRKIQVKSNKQIKEIKEKIIRLENQLSTISFHLQSVVLDRNKYTLNYPYNEERQEQYNKAIEGLTKEKKEIKKQIKELKNQLKEVWKTPNR